MDPVLKISKLMRTELNEHDVQEEVFTRNFLYGSGVQDQDVREKRKQRVSEMIDDFERGISAGSTVLDYLIKNGLYRPSKGEGRRIPSSRRNRRMPNHG